MNVGWTPADADKPKVRFSSSDTSIAEADGQGRVYAASPGRVKITTTAVNGASLKVTRHLEIQQKSLTAIRLYAPNLVSSDSYGDIIPIEKIEEIFYMDVSSSPYEEDKYELNWSLSNNSITSVSMDGKVSIKNTGAVTITARQGGCEAS